MQASDLGLSRVLEAKAVEVLGETSLLHCRPPPAFAAASEDARESLETSLLTRLEK